MLAAALACLAGVSPARAAAFDIVAATGDGSPDGNGSLLLFTPPALNDAGEVAFFNTLIGTENGAADNVGLFRGSSAGLDVVARTGDSFDGDTILSFANSPPAINGAGTVSQSAVVSSTPNETVAFLGSGGALTILPRVGTASPGGDNMLVGRSLPVINDAGLAVYRARYNGAEPEIGIYARAADGTLTTRLVDGTDFDVVDEGTENEVVRTVSGLVQSLPTLNATGQVALTASIDDELFSRKGAMRLDDTTVVPLAIDGDTTIDESATIHNILSHALPLNDAGQVAFAATYDQGDGTRHGVFRADEAGATLVVPGMLDESPEPTRNMRVLDINNAGRVAVATDFGTGTDPVTGLYLADDAETELIALEDTATPGGDRYFRSLVPESMALNDAGQVAFMADLSETLDGPHSGRGLFFYDPASGLEQIVVTGGTLAGGTIASVNLLGAHPTIDESLANMQSPDSSYSGLNEAGQVGFLFSLAGGNGVAIWSSDSEPVPGDYNGNGIVDAADYTVWRDHLGQDIALPNEDPSTTPGQVTHEDYAFWKSQFGQSGSGASTVGQAAVPEPAAWLLALAAAVLGLAGGVGRPR